MTTNICECCAKKFYGAELEKGELVKALALLVEYFEVELNWENFRAEFLARDDVEYEKASLRNAAIITKALDSYKTKWPDIAKYISRMGDAE